MSFDDYVASETWTFSVSTGAYSGAAAGAAAGVSKPNWLISTLDLSTESTSVSSETGPSYFFFLNRLPSSNSSSASVL